MTRDYSVNKKIIEVMEEGDKRPGRIAEKSHIRKDIFSKIIHCQRVVFADEVAPIARALGVSVDALLGSGDESE